MLFMGMFSWRTSDTNESISNCFSQRETFDVYVLIPKAFGGGNIIESEYEGYGEFGGEDIYELLATWNADAVKEKHKKYDLRNRGISLYFDEELVLKYPIKIVRNPNLTYEEAKPSRQCEFQGYFYE